MAETTLTIEERWLPIPGFEGWYSVSDRGRVRREADPHRGKSHGGRILEFRGTAKRYLQANLSKDAVAVSRAVHELVMLAFVGERPEGSVINHKDGNKRNNRLENLEYCTYGFDRLHSRRVLGQCVGELHYKAKFTADDVRAIRRLHASGVKQTELGQRYGVRQSHIQAIVSRRIWKCVQ